MNDIAAKRDLNLSQYDISKFRYRELNNFCLQYPEWIEQKKSCYSLGATAISDMPRGSNIGNPTAERAERALQLARNIEMVEQTAIATDSELYPWVLKAVTEGVPWSILQPPCGERQFRRVRRKFYYLLSFKK